MQNKIRFFVPFIALCVALEGVARFAVFFLGQTFEAQYVHFNARSLLLCVLVLFVALNVQKTLKRHVWPLFGLFSMFFLNDFLFCGEFSWLDTSSLIAFILITGFNILNDVARSDKRF